MYKVIPQIITVGKRKNDIISGNGLVWFYLHSRKVESDTATYTSQQPSVTTAAPAAAVTLTQSFHKAYDWSIEPLFYTLLLILAEPTGNMLPLLISSSV